MKTAIVTGGAQGIGLEVGRQLAEAGVRLNSTAVSDQSGCPAKGYL